MTEGRVICAGQAAEDAEVLALRGDELVAHTRADADGRFALEVPQPDGVRLLARCRRPAAGLALAPLADDLELRLEDLAPAWPVEVAAVEGVPDGPHQPFVQFVPLALGSLPEQDVRWSMRRVGNRADSVYLNLLMDSGRLEWPLQEGRWWFSAELVILSDPQIPGDELPAPLAAVDAKRGDGRPLEPMRGGWALDVDGACRVEIRLAPVS